jgi:hypothetical protein
LALRERRCISENPTPVGAVSSDEKAWPDYKTQLTGEPIKAVEVVSRKDIEYGLNVVFSAVVRKFQAIY